MQRQKQERKESLTDGDGIALSGVSHGFDGTAVLDDVSVAVEQGETLAVIGPSGTGKTTLLRLLAMFDQPDEGTVTVDGSDAWSVSERERLALRRKIGMVFQEANLFDASVRQNVSYGLRVRRGWRERVRQWVSRIGGFSTPQRISEKLAVVGMDDVATQNVQSLSGGEAQRVAFARALAYEPAFLLLDEPTSDLDPRNTAVIEEAIETTRTEGLGVVIATHDMNQAERVADRVAVMIDGQIIESGPSERVFSAPEDPRAQKFIDGELVYEP